MNEGRPRRKFWGWGDVGQGLDETEQEALRKRLAAHYGAEMRGPAPPRPEEIALRPPRIAPPMSLAAITTTDRWERLVHAYGRSFPDIVRVFQRHVPEPPDVVAFPETEAQVVELLDWADSAGAAAIPYGGGSSVVGGVEPAVGDGYRGTISIDLGRLDQVLEVDRESRAARIQAGARGPELEAQLKPHGYTLRHFPQSFEHSTLGGWIVTRSGGHFATLYTHIDDFVESTRMVTPRGVMETRRLPGSGAGPSPDRLVIGSEGILGILTEAWMRLQDVPRFRASRAVRFASIAAGAAGVRALTQAGLYPSNCRLLDAEEAATAGAGDGAHAILVLGFESGDHPVDAWMERALELVADHGGLFETPDARPAAAAGDAAHRGGAVGAWRDAFLRAPFYREVTVPWGVLGETFESACTWDRFATFHDGIKQEMRKVLREVSGREGRITCRFTHAYPDGPAPYFSYQTLGTFEGALAQWREIKAAANEIVIRLGGTITHHHAVGRDHRPGYEREIPPLFLHALAAAKQSMDPNGIMNPGVLIDPVGRSVGVTGALSDRGGARPGPTTAESGS
ncbi:MAG TPA: FAD-binding oxidoreductase [Thermoanaerobaculia bacterium]|nr:FAD-binding oxidoreductase [Thermoanaerobaculia bacterium]